MNFNEALDQDWGNNAESEIGVDQEARNDAEMKFFIPSCQTTMSQRMEAMDMPEEGADENPAHVSAWSKAGATTLSILVAIFKVLFFIVKWIAIGALAAMVVSKFSGSNNDDSGSNDDSSNEEF